MAVKQHCDICDNVIPGDESFRVIRYGRGQNLDIQTGNDPKIVCKECWRKMWAAVSTDQPRDIDHIGDTKFLSKAEARRYKSQIDSNKNAINQLHGILDEIRGEKPLKTCKTCKHSDVGSDGEPCNKCLGLSLWEEKSDGEKLL